MQPVERPAECIGVSCDPPDRIDNLIHWLVVALLAFMPLAFGATDEWSKEVVVLLSACIFLVFLFKVLWLRAGGFVRTWAYIPLALFLLICMFQLVPLPFALVSAISPNTAAMREQLLGDLPKAEGLLKTVPLSFYPNATRHDLRLAISAAAVFVVVLNTFRRPRQIRRLLAAIAVIGGIVALIALAQDIFGNGKIYWTFTSPNKRSLSGPFVNRNHYGQFMNLSIGATLAWFCVKVRQDLGGRRLTPAVMYDYLGSRSARLLWAAILMMAVGAATIFISLTRGGMVSILIAMTLTTVLLVSRPSLRGEAWAMVLVTLAAFVCILYVGFDAVFDRFTTLSRFEGYEDRWQTLQDLTVVYRRFPAFGMGLGTHAVVYPMFKNINNSLLYTHAENEYAQLFEEVGAVGLILMLVFGAIILRSFIKAIRGSGEPIHAAAFGLGFGIIAILVHSFSDYGQHIPANGFLTATFCGLMISLAHRPDPTTGTRESFIRVPAFRLLGLGIAVLAVLVFVWAAVGADRARVAEANWDETLRIEKSIKKRNWKADEKEYDLLIATAAKALEQQPGNVRYRYWHTAYQWRAISQRIYAESDMPVFTDSDIRSIRKLVKQFHQACRTCPTYGPPYSVVGQIEKFILNEDGGAEKIRKGYRLAPTDPVTCFVAGRLDLLEGRIVECTRKFDRAVSLDPQLFDDVIDIYMHELSRPELAIAAAGDNTSWLSRVANRLEEMQYMDMAAQVRQRIVGLLEARCNEPDAPASAYAALARQYEKKGDVDAALEFYRKALALDYGQISWRYRVAALLADMNRLKEAMDQADTCLRLSPGYKPAQRLVADIATDPAMLAERVEAK